MPRFPRQPTLAAALLFAAGGGQDIFAAELEKWAKVVQLANIRPE